MTIPVIRAFEDYERVEYNGTLNDALSDEKADKARFHGLVEPHARDFIKLKPRKLNTKNADDYDAILSDPERWTAFERDSIDAYFQDTVAMFPDATTADPEVAKVVSERQKAHDENAATDSYFEFPPDFYKIQVAMIEKRFPGGENGTIGDQDLRNCVSSLRYMFKENFYRLVMDRRRYLANCIWGLLGIWLLLAATAGGLAIAAKALGTLDNSVFIIAAAVYSIVLLVVFFGYQAYIQFNFKDMKKDFDTSIEMSASVVSEALRLRIQNCVSNIENLFAKIEFKKMQFNDENRLREWPAEATKWVKLACWIAYRVEYIDLFAQIEIWRIARTRAGIRASGRIKSYWYAGAGLAACLAAMIAVVVAAILFGQDWDVAVPQVPAISCYITGALCLYLLVAMTIIWRVSYMTLQNALPDLNKIRAAVTSDSRMSFRDTKLLKVIADFIRLSKSNELYQEDLSKH